MTPDDPRHGTTAGHAAGCRLTCCREARNSDERQRRKHREVLGIIRTVDKTGTVRRIQALWAIGWTSAHIAKACGWGAPQAVTEIVAVRSHTYRATAETVARVYDELCMTLGPSAKNRRDAARKGWAPPLAWDDIDHDEAPTGVGYLSPDRGEAVRDLLDMGAGLSEALRRLDLKPDALENWCRRNGMAEQWRELVRRDRGEVAA